MRIAYADPPYPGLAHLYADQPEYSGEIDHAALIARLERFDGWVLHTHTKGIPTIAALVPEGARWGAWVKTFAAFKRNVRPSFAWEPVIFKPCRRLAPPHGKMGLVQRDWIACPMTMRRGFIGAKPEAVCHWAFEIVGAEPSDELVDLFPGSGAVGRAWQTWRPQFDLFERAYDPNLDALESYNAAVIAIGERVKAGAPVPEFLLSRKAPP